MKRQTTIWLWYLPLALLFACKEKPRDVIADNRPNILFCVADDWGWPHAGIYGDKVVKTPHFDRLAQEGVLFNYAYVSSPSCTPSRGALLTGQHFWRLGAGANLHSTLDKSLPVYPLLMEAAGYFVGSWRKAWGPGILAVGGYAAINPAGKSYPKGFSQFLAAKPANTPFCFWLGASDPHRGYETDSGINSGMAINEIEVPPFFPDDEIIRRDIADYYFEVQRFDSDVGAAIQLLDSLDELANTIIVVTGDHGMPFPRCKANLYDMGTRVPLVVYGEEKWQQNRTIDDFVSLTDLAPTFLDFAGIPIPKKMTGKSLKPLLEAKKNHKTTDRSHIIFGRERHTPAQRAPSIVGYPSRAIRTEDFLYIHNYFTDRWPVGVPEKAAHPIRSFADCDNGPTKDFIVKNGMISAYQTYYDWCFAKRPANELYDLRDDPYQIKNVAALPAYATVRDSLSAKLNEMLTETEDPRIIPNKIDFDTVTYRGPYELHKG
ncbi:MAG: sulfatase [Bacteroidota bacterium]